MGADKYLLAKADDCEIKVLDLSTGETKQPKWRCKKYQICRIHYLYEDNYGVLIVSDQSPNPEFKQMVGFFITDNNGEIKELKQRGDHA